MTNQKKLLSSQSVRQKELEKKRQEGFGRWQEAGGFVPLFDKLTDNDLDSSYEANPLTIYSRSEVEASIVKEIENLFNTRINLPKKDYLDLCYIQDACGYPTLYGIPDFSFFDAVDEGTWRAYAETLERAVEFYEPRLKSPRIVFDRFDPNTQTLKAHIAGDIILNEMAASFSFSVVLRNQKTA